MTKELFDYTNVSSSDYAYYGFHLKEGRYHIDTKRIIKLGYKSRFPDELFIAPRNTHYFIPKYKYENDWAVNILLACVNQLESDWNHEYKTVIDKIMKPKDVEEQERLNALMYSSSVDDIDDINETAFLAGIHRIGKYDQVIKSIHLQYLQKIFVEFFRSLLIVISDRGYTNKDDFTYGKLVEYVMNCFKVSSKKANPLYTLKHYKWFDVLNKIDNFLKHNTVTAYNSLANNAYERNENIKRFYSSFVYSSEEAKTEYINGSYAGNWLKIGPNFVDKILKNIREFAKEFCELLYKENSNEAFWNSDEFLLKRLKDEIIYSSY